MAMKSRSEAFTGKYLSGLVKAQSGNVSDSSTKMAKKTSAGKTRMNNAHTALDIMPEKANVATLSASALKSIQSSANDAAKAADEAAQAAAKAAQTATKSGTGSRKSSKDNEETDNIDYSKLWRTKEKKRKWAEKTGRETGKEKVAQAAENGTKSRVIVNGVAYGGGQTQSTATGDLQQLKAEAVENGTGLPTGYDRWSRQQREEYAAYVLTAEKTQTGGIGNTLAGLFGGLIKTIQNPETYENALNAMEATEAAAPASVANPGMQLAKAALQAKVKWDGHNAQQAEDSQNWIQNTAAAYEKLSGDQQRKLQQYTALNARLQEMNTGDPMMMAVDENGMQTDGSREIQQAAQLRKDLEADGLNVDDLSTYQGMMETGDGTEQMRQWAQEVVDSSAPAAAAMSIASVPASLLGGAFGAADVVGQKLNRALTGSAAPVDVNTGFQALSNFSDETRGRTEENIQDWGTEKYGTGAGKALGLVYGAGMSSLDSMATALMGGPAATAILGTAAANSAYKDAKANGAGDDAALASAVMNGVFEGFFESFSISNLRGMQQSTVRGVKDVAKNYAKTMLGEGSEEMATELADMLVNAVLLGDNSQTSIRYKELLAQGYTEAQAQARLSKESALQIVDAGIGGALGGTFSATAGNLMGARNYLRQANGFSQGISNDVMQALYEEARAARNVDSPQAKTFSQAADKLQKIKKPPSATQQYDLYRRAVDYMNSLESGAESTQAPGEFTLARDLGLMPEGQTAGTQQAATTPDAGAVNILQEDNALEQNVQPQQNPAVLAQDAIGGTDAVAQMARELGLQRQNAQAVENATGVTENRGAQNAEQVTGLPEMQIAQNVNSMYTRPNETMTGGTINGRTAVEGRGEYDRGGSEGILRSNGEWAAPGQAGTGNVDSRGEYIPALREHVPEFLSGQPTAAGADVETSLESAGIGANAFRNASAAPEIFSQALAEGKKNSPDGACVDYHTPEEMQEIVDGGGMCFLTDDGTAGGAVTGDGNLTGVFKDKTRSTAKRAGIGIAVTGVQNGAIKGDCFGQYLVNQYSAAGFEPVGRMAYAYGFNQEMDAYVRERLKKGIIKKEPDVYALKLRPGSTMQGVLSGVNEAHLYTQAELDALPEFTGENGYDEMLGARDAMIAQQGIIPIGQDHVERATGLHRNGPAEAYDVQREAPWQLQTEEDVGDLDDLPEWDALAEDFGLERLPALSIPVEDAGTKRKTESEIRETGARESVPLEHRDKKENTRLAQQAIGVSVATKSADEAISLLAELYDEMDGEQYTYKEAREKAKSVARLMVQQSQVEGVATKLLDQKPNARYKQGDPSNLDDASGGLEHTKDRMNEKMKQGGTGIEWKSLENADRETAPVDDFEQIPSKTISKKMSVQPEIKEPTGNTAADMLLARPVQGSVALQGNAEVLRQAEQTKQNVEAKIQTYKDATGATRSEDFAAQDVANGKELQDVLQPADRAYVVETLSNLYQQQEAGKHEGIAGQKEQIYASEWTRMANILKAQDASELVENARVGNIQLNMRTPERVVKKVFGSTLGQRIYDGVFKPVQANESSKVQTLNQLFRQVDSLGLSEADSAMVHLVGSQEKGNDKKPVTIEDLRTGSLDRSSLPVWMDAKQAQKILEQAKACDPEKVQAGVEMLRGLYDGFEKTINDFRVIHGMPEIGHIENYMPNFTADDPVVKMLKDMGLEGVKDLPVEIAGQTWQYRPNSRWVANFQNRSGPRTSYDALTGFQQYASAVVDMLYHTDDVMRMRVLDSYVRRTAKMDVESIVDSIKGKMAAISTGRFPGSNVEITQEQREYLQRVLKGDYMDMEKGDQLSTFAQWLTQYTNKLAGKQVLGDRAVESDFGRQALNMADTVLSRYGANAVVGNISSALNNGVTLPKILATSKTTSAAKAAWGLVSGAYKRSGIAEQSEFLKVKKGVDWLVQSKTQKISKAIGDHVFEPFEQAVTDFAYYTKYIEAMDAGATQAQATQQANDYARHMMSSRDKGSRSVYAEEKSPGIKLFTMFQNEVSNDFFSLVQDLPEWYVEQAGMGNGAEARKKIAIGGAKYIAYSYVLGAIYKAVTGYDPTNNVLQWIIDYIGAIGDAADRGDVADAVKATGKLVGNGLDAVPYVSTGLALFGLGNGRLPLPQFDFDKIGNAGGEMFTHDDDGVNWPYVGENLFKGLVKPASMVALPFGANQLWKTGEGLTTMARGALTTQTKKGEMATANTNQSNPAEWGQGAIFGKSAIGSVRDYWDSGASELGGGNITSYNQLVSDFGMVPKDAVKAIKGVGNVLGNKTVSEDGKEVTVTNSQLGNRAQAAEDMVAAGSLDQGAADVIVYNNMTAVQKAMADSVIEAGGSVTDFALFYAELSTITGDGSKGKKIRLLNDWGLSGDLYDAYKAAIK